MRYHYFYQSPKNESLDGWITAKDRNDAYNLLRKQGIKPYKVIGRNPIAWKRWAAIGVLGAAVAALSVLQVADRPVVESEEPRAQLYGDPAIIQQLAADGWRRTFDPGDAWFARHAIPATFCDCREHPPTNIVLSVKPLKIDPSEPPELAKMKRMVNSMKREFAAYCVVNGNTASDYMALCDERLAIERGHVAIYRKEFNALEKADGDIEAAWEQKNDELREMGLPTVPMPMEGE